ncbi:MAG: hypothetical protein COU11_02120 [Candidatus Harrisonbacteria bacterium CG10_big_fil_rev_8_21_14_0_10_49_15]|uniref:PsbP C-terminal domain-containing protein n=1 Tax=Candidatus Harrisonbacteria bacterium CG10_big_fil_rev_8_21_14_0_10_49_15 TaxID=1974587 RepID=A0A2H0UMK8_9BACT|nr:MAG: hypothetical protein COU11_02120 [Candidatus Harrisonbacteria bacterium CG10_big_fil_rev_8_21_14_0_10_49_15]
MRKIVIPILILLAVGALIIALATDRGAKLPDDTHNGNATSTLDFVAYTAPADAYTVQYPRSWRLNESPPVEGVATIITSPDAMAYVAIGFVENEALTEPGGTSQLIKELEAALRANSDYTIDGFEERLVSDEIQGYSVSGQLRVPDGVLHFREVGVLVDTGVGFVVRGTMLEEGVAAHEDSVEAIVESFRIGE